MDLGFKFRQEEKKRNVYASGGVIGIMANKAFAGWSGVEKVCSGNELCKYHSGPVMR